MVRESATNLLLKVNSGWYAGTAVLNNEHSRKKYGHRSVDLRVLVGAMT